jgi:outer membrane receptor protein involved in Fe transport
VYLLDEWTPHPRFSVSAGLRVDHYQDLSTTPITPRLALIGRPYANGVTKLVAGQAFRAPNVYELYYGDYNLTQRPALSLEPETITTFELEHSHDVTEELRVTVAGYHNRISKLVVLGTDEGTPQCGAAGDPEACLVYQNTPDVLSATGAEAELRWQPGRFAMVDLSYSYVTLSGATPEIQAGSPHHLVSARVLAPLGETGVRLAFQTTYQSARTAPDGSHDGEALLMNVGLSGEVEHLRYFAGVKNLLDERYALPAGDEFSQPTIPQYGRTFLVQLTAGF